MSPATAAAISPNGMAGSIEQAWARFVSRDRRPPAPHPYVYASGWRACDRRLVLDMTVPHEAPPFGADVLARFRRGNDRERDLLADLAKIGRDAEPSFEVVGQQERFELKDRKGRTVITGKVDARLRIDRQSSPPLEVKAWAPQLVDRVDRFEDLFDQPWTRSGAYQLLSYLYATNQPFGFMLLDRAGLPLPLPVELEPHLDRVEEFLTRAEQAVDHVVAGTLPDFLVGNAAECQRCSYYGTACNPPLAAGSLTVLTDPELEAQLARRDELYAAAKEFDRLDTAVKKKLRGVEQGIAGAFHIRGAWGKNSRVVLPDDLKAKFTVTDPKGKFTLEITRLGDAKPAEVA